MYTKHAVGEGRGALRLLPKDYKSAMAVQLLPAAIICSCMSCPLPAILSAASHPFATSWSNACETPSEVVQIGAHRSGRSLLLMAGYLLSCCGAPLLPAPLSDCSVNLPDLQVLPAGFSEWSPVIRIGHLLSWLSPTPLPPTCLSCCMIVSLEHPILVALLMGLHASQSERYNNGTLTSIV